MSELKDRLAKAMARRKELAADGESVKPATLAAACGVKSPSVSDWFSGATKSLKGDNLLRAAAYLRVNPGWLSEGKGQMELEQSSDTNLAVLNESVTAYLPGFDTLSVPLLATSASMGPGVDQHDDVVIGRLTLRPEWVTKVLTSLSRPANLRFIHGYGDSMEPTFQDGDILLVDTGVPAVKVDGIYVLEANERLYIKRVRQRLDGSFEISSDNPTVKTVDVLNGSHTVTVKGRVVWVWNGKKM